MRTPVYVLAALVAAFIAYSIASSPQQPAQQEALAANTAGSPAFEEPGSLTLRVDDMHCEYGCFPKVKKTLEGFDEVVGVELDEQAEAGTLDNPQVVVTYRSGFDLGAAQAALAKSGFGKSSAVE